MRRVACAIVPLLLLARPAATEPPFSRARWIELHEHEARFDGGALAGREDELAEAALLAARADVGKGHKPSAGVWRGWVVRAARRQRRAAGDRGGAVLRHRPGERGAAARRFPRRAASRTAVHVRSPSR